MTVERSKRRSLLALTFIAKSVSITRTFRNWKAVIGQLRCTRVNQVH